MRILSLSAEVSTRAEVTISIYSLLSVFPILSREIFWHVDHFRGHPSLGEIFLFRCHASFEGLLWFHAYLWHVYLFGCHASFSFFHSMILSGVPPFVWWFADTYFQGQHPQSISILSVNKLIFRSFSAKSLLLRQFIPSRYKDGILRFAFYSPCSPNPTLPPRPKKNRIILREPNHLGV